MASTLTMQDIADLAGVQRAVVSTWRGRIAIHGRVFPFPTPVQVDDGVERFAVDDVVAYLADTGRGTNADAATDAPTLATPEGANLDSVVALLCLAALSGEELDGRGPDGLAVLAEQVDPDDQFLRGEVTSSDWVTDLTGYVDELLSGSFGAGDALARLDAGPLSRAVGERGLTPSLVQLAQAVVGVCRTHAGDDDVLLDVSGDRDLDGGLVAGFAGVSLAGEDADLRGQRRRAALLQWPVVENPGSAPIVRVRSLVGVADTQIVQVLDEVVLGLRAGDLAVVIGPASALVDPLTGALERDRASTLRHGPLAVALRLPRGMWRGAHRQSLALWVLLGGVRLPSVRLADLDGVPFDAIDLAADVAAALARTETRSYRYLRQRDLDPILAGGPVIPRGTRAVRLVTTSGVEHLTRVRAASLASAEPLHGFDVLVSSAASQVVLRSRSLGELADGRLVRLLRGQRVDRAWGDPAGTVPVLSADGATEGLRLDPFDAARRFPRAQRTEPGDVVFMEKPRPVALVDALGGSLVNTPSRILRLASNAPVRPHLLADRINRASPGSEWRTWEIPELPRPDAEALDDRLAEAARYRAELRRREQGLDGLITALVDGVATGTVAVHTAEPHHVLRTPTESR